MTTASLLGLLLAGGGGTVPFELPAGEPAATWVTPLKMAGFAPGDAGAGAGVEVVAVGGRWRVQVRDDRGGLHVVTVDVPVTDRGREDLVWLAQSLLHPAQSILVGSPTRPPEPPPLPPVVPGEPTEGTPPRVRVPRPPRVIVPAWLGLTADAGADVGRAASRDGVAGVRAGVAEPMTLDLASSSRRAGGEVAGASVAEGELLIARPERRPLTWVVAGGAEQRGGVPFVGGASVRVRVPILAQSAGAWQAEAWLFGSGGAVPDGLAAGQRLWEGYAALGVGWSGEGRVRLGFGVGPGCALAALEVPGAATGVPLSPSAWLAPRVSVAVAPQLSVEGDLAFGMDLYAPSFVGGESAGKAVDHVWLRPAVGLAWTPGEGR